MTPDDRKRFKEAAEWHRNEADGYAELNRGKSDVDEAMSRLEERHRLAASVLRWLAGVEVVASYCVKHMPEAQCAESCKVSDLVALPDWEEWT